MKKNKKFNSTALFMSGLIATSAIVAPLVPSIPVGAEAQEVETTNSESTKAIPTVVATKSIFKDLSNSYVYLDIIQKMHAQKIIKGYEDGTFRPSETLSRKHAAALVNRAVTLETSKSSKRAPKDLSKKNPNYNDLMELYQAGLLELDSKGNINPNAKLTRGEMAKILAVAFKLEGKSNPFTDVSKAYEPYVNALYDNDITTGFEDGTFKEKQSLTRSHFAVFMYRAMEYEEEVNKSISEYSEEEVENFTKEELFASVVMFNNKFEETGVPLPEGETDRVAFTQKVNKQYAIHSVQNRFNRVVTISMASKGARTTEPLLKNMAEKILERPLKEVIGLMNETVEKGIVTNDEKDKVPFVMYFDYVRNELIFSYALY